MLKTSRFLTGALIASSALVPFAVSAAAPTPTPHAARLGMHRAPPAGAFMKRPPMVKGQKPPMPNMMHKGNMISGTVASINGTTLSLTDAKGVAYTVDASKVKFPLTNIKIGDKVMVMGTVTGTSVAATMVNDPSNMSRTVFGGKVTALNGTNITIAGRNATTQTVDASQATLTKGFMKNSTAITIADIKVGDEIMVTGTVNGTAITAKSVNDMGVPHAFAGKGMPHGPRPVKK